MAAASVVHVPLLEAEQEYHEGCPGCLLERRKIAAKGAPKKELTFVAVMVLCNALPISSLFPFIYFMVRDFGIAKLDTNIGTYAGFIGSALMFGRFLTAALWGIVADRYGRKPVMVIGTATIVVFNTLFGFSNNFWLALTSRFFLGLFNGTLGSVRAYASEICSREHQALGLSMVGTMGGLGLIIGPALGGYLAQPSDKYPSLFPSGSLFDRFPYALPCVCISAFALVGLVFSFWLPESLHNHKGAPKSTRKREEAPGSKSNIIEIKEGKDNAIVGPKDKARAAKKPIWKNWGMVAAISIYCVWGLHDMAFSEIFSLWAVSPEDYGGLGFTTAEVFSVALVAVYPLLSILDGVSLWILLTFASVIKNVFSVCIVTGAFLLINNSVMITERGLANGISMSFMSLFKAIGPASAGVLFSWAQGRIHASFLPGMWMIFFILDIIVVITFILTLEPILPKSLLNPLPEESDTLDSRKDALERSSSFTFD